MSKNKIKGKYNLELNFPGDGRLFLNYWDTIRGEDVCAQVITGDLFIDNEDISFSDFLDKVIKSIRNGQE